MLIVISGFTCLCQCVFLIICNLSSFSVRNGESMFCAAFLSKKLICQILKLAPSLVYHGLIRALLSLTLIGSLGEFVLFSMIFFKMKGHFKLISHLDPSPKMWGFFLSSSCPYFSIFGLFQKKIRRLFETYFFQKIPGIFRFAILSLEILEKAKLHLRKFHKIVLQPLGISRPETKTHGNST